MLRAGIHRVCNKSEPGVNKEKPQLGTLMKVQDTKDSLPQKTFGTLPGKNTPMLSSKKCKAVFPG